MKSKNILRIIIAVIVILMIPLVAMQFTDEVAWTFSDFLIAGILLLGAGLTYEFASSRAGSMAYKTAVGIAVLVSLALIWINGAVGIIGSEDNPANLLYGIVILVGIIGAFIARFNARKMSNTMIAMAIAQAIVPVIALIIWRPDFSPGVIGVFVLNTLFVLAFIASAVLFRRSLEPLASSTVN